MDLVYAHGQVEGALSDGAQGVGANPTWGIVPGSTARVDFYRDDVLRYHGRQNRGHRVANLLRGTVAAPAQASAPVGAMQHDASTREGFTYQVQPAYASAGWTLHWTAPAADGQMRLSVVARKSTGWLAVGFTGGSQGMVGSTALVGFAEGDVGWYALTAKNVAGVLRLPNPNPNPNPNP